MAEKASDQATAPGPKNDRDSQEEDFLRQQLARTRHELEIERAKSKAIDNLTEKYQVTLTPASTTEGPRSTLDLIGSIPWEKPKAFLAFMAIVLYGAIRFADGAFYARLGLTPEDVGLNPAVILARSAMVFVLLIASIVLLSFWGFAVKRRLSNLLVLIGLVLIFPGLILFRTLFPLPEFAATDLGARFFSSTIILAGGLLGYLVAWQDDLGQQRRGRSASEAAVASTSKETNANPSVEDSQYPVDVTNSRRRFVIVELAMVAVILFGLAGVVGYSSAERVMRGELLRCGCVPVMGRNLSLPWLSGGPGFLGVRVQHAEIAWNMSPRKPPPWLSLPMKVMYLGQADGMIVVYDHNNQRPLRFPVGAVLLRVYPEPATWQESSSYEVT